MTSSANDIARRCRLRRLQASALTALLAMPGMLALTPPPIGSLNSPAYSGYSMRAHAMSVDANSRGASDQWKEALRLYPESSAEERARIEQALTAMTIPGADAMALLEKFVRDYPASAWRAEALMAVGDVWFDRGEYAQALRVYNRLTPSAYSDAQGADLTYRTAFSRLKLMDYEAASTGFRTLENSPYHANDARFYLGYIAYANKDYAQARRMFESVRPNGMPTAATNYYLAQIAYSQGDYKSAEAHAKALLQSSCIPEIDASFIAEMNRVEGESLFRLGHKNEAIPFLETYVADTATPLPSALYLLGINDYECGRYEQAIDRLTPVSADASAMGQSAYLYIGQSYLALKNYNAATMAFEKAARMDGDRSVQETAFYNLAVARMQGGKVPFGSSVAVFEAFLRRYPNSVHAPQVADYVITGYMTDNNYQAALNAINNIQNPSARVLAAKQKVLYILGTRELQGGRAKQACTYLREAAAMKEVDGATAADATLWLGEAQFKNGDYKGSVESLNDYLRQNHGSAENRALAYYDLGYARLALKDFADAKSDFRKFIDRGGATADRTVLTDAYNRLGDSQYYLSDFSGAADTYAKAYKTNPSTGDYPLYQLAIMTGLQRDHKEKIRKLNEMIQKFPQSALTPSALLEMGESYGELADNARAIETYTTLTSRFPSTAQGRQGELLLAITYLNEGDKAQAIAHYKKVITSYPTSAEAAVAADDLKQLYADQGAVNKYVEFINSVPDAPKPETAELSRLTLLSAEKAADAGRWEAAAAAATEVVEKYPDSPQATEAWSIKANAETMMGHTADAMRSYTALEQRASDATTANAARMGILHLSRDLGEYGTTIETADKLLESSALGEAAKREVMFTKAVALANTGQTADAETIWTDLASDIDDLYGTKSQFYLADAYAQAGKNEKALAAVNKLINANPPHDYWLARGFILLSDLLRAKGDTFEADEYLRSLRENYPGNETDIPRMIDERLK